MKRTKSRRKERRGEEVKEKGQDEGGRNTIKGERTGEDLTWC
jgi:hypothetical protein